MSELLSALEGKGPIVSGQRNLRTLFLIEACLMLTREGRVIDFKELCQEYGV